MFKKPFVVLDLETSGTDPVKSQIIEVAVIRYEEGKEVDRYESLVKIDEALEPIITIITGITDEDLKRNGQPWEQVKNRLEEVIKDAFIVAHNTAFDVGFLNAKKVKYKPLGFLDTIPLAQIFFPELTSYSLESLTDDLNITHNSKHRAMSDTEATLDLFKKINEKITTLPQSILQEIKSIGQRAQWDGLFLFDQIGSNSELPPLNPNSESFSHLDFFPSSESRKSLSVPEVLGESGLLKGHWPDFESRPQQIQMSQAVQSAFQESYHLICEAPTGVGKSLAYLVPAVELALQNKKRVVISTNTINLQEQLYEKDVPILQKIYQQATGQSGFRAALLKGRRHYLCLRRLALYKQKSFFSEPEIVLLIKILVWQKYTKTDEASEISLTRDESMIWDYELSADQKYCTPSKCKPYGNCYLHRARTKAEAADVIIVNHALLCSDMQKDGGLLPEYEHLIVDEAHQFENACTGSFGVSLQQENFQIPLKAIRSQLEILQKQYAGTLFASQFPTERLEALIDFIPDIELNLDNLFSLIAYFISRHVESNRFMDQLLIDSVMMASEDWINLGVSAQDFRAQMRSFLNQSHQVINQFLSLNEKASEQQDWALQISQEIEVLEEQMDSLDQFFADENPLQFIRWITARQNGVVQLHLTPYVPGDLLNKKLYSKKKSVIFTSATLGVKLKQRGYDESDQQQPFRYFKTILGIDEQFEELVLDSPFDFETQATVYVPSDLIPIQSPKSTPQLLPFFKNLIHHVKGGMLSLFTSYRMIETLYMDLIHHFKHTDTQLLAQRLSGGRNKVMKAYLKKPTQSVLLGTSSFWEGVDIKGDALTTLVIHKLPFDVPSDPICKARSQLFQNGFMEYFVPRAILKFRQGFGRLIRSKKDYGVMVILDNRVIHKDYGRLFLDALPDYITIEQIPLSEVPGNVEEWLKLKRS